MSILIRPFQLIITSDIEFEFNNSVQVIIKKGSKENQNQIRFQILKFAIKNAGANGEYNGTKSNKQVRVKNKPYHNFKTLRDSKGSDF